MKIYYYEKIKIYLFGLIVIIVNIIVNTKRLHRVACKSINYEKVKIIPLTLIVIIINIIVIAKKVTFIYMKLY